ncbi:unnamed protein product [Cylicocyclus nassatus]|uniref:Uncharacterized protein n=1 Tax=Cylicocyclus nassatus TaxID=53992 RepID=A0AA36GIY1_CYLNA|nr:unnamed protein product [Cylicocyclus nassatus]
MSHTHRPRRAEGYTRRESHYSHEHLESFGRLPSYDIPRGHLWVEEAASERDYDGLGCPVHGSAYSTHSVWRPVQQDSRESRQIFENETRPLCPVHKRPASIVSSESMHTALYDDEIVTIDAEPKQEQREPIRASTSKHSKHSKRSKRSKHSKRSKSRSRHTFSQKSLNEEENLQKSEHPSQSGSRYSLPSDDNLSTRSYSTGISLTTTASEGYDYNSRATSLFNILKNFADKYPRFALFLAILIFAYFFMNQVDLTIAHIFESFIRFAYPASHYIAVTNEQFFARLARMATRSDEVMEAFYCDFARTWCERFELMCDVRCSFVEQTLQRIRKHPH